MHDAANAASLSVHCNLDAQGKKATSLLAWILKYGKQVRELYLSGCLAGCIYNTRVKLDTLVTATSNLQSLNLQWLHVSQTEGDSQPLAKLAAMPNFKQLRLSMVGWDLEQDTVRALHTLTNLQDLQLMSPKLGCMAKVGLHSTLTALLQLTRLWVEGDWATNYVLGNLSDVTGLHELQLGYCSRLKQPVLAGLQSMQQLTGLEILHAAQLHVRDSEVPFSFSALTALAHLRLSGPASLHFKPLITFPTAQLRHLELAGPVDGNRAAVLAVLAWIAGMSQLLHLDLSGSINAWLPYQSEYSQYSALTATQLQVLKISKCNVQLQQAWPYLFSSRRKRPALRQLQLHLSSADENPIMSEDSQLTEGRLCHLMVCCPGLQYLDVSGALRATHLVRELSSFTQLTALTVTGASAADVGYLTGLRGLHSLRLTFSPKALKLATLAFAADDPQRQQGALQHLRGTLQQLSALVALTRLEVPGVLREPITAGAMDPDDHAAQVGLTACSTAVQLGARMPFCWAASQQC
jgi:hypothetical protein